METGQIKIIITIGLIILFSIVILVIEIIADKKKKQQDHKEELFSLYKKIKNRKPRIIITEADEKDFWNMIEKINTRSNNNYFNSLGLFKDYITNYSPKELIELDNLYIRLIRENINQNICAAAAIIFKSNENKEDHTLLLMNILMTNGQVFFNQACNNPNLIIGKEFTDLRNRLYNDVIHELYLNNTKEIIPKFDDETLNFDIPGEKWDYEDLPIMYNELWRAFNSTNN